MKEEEFLNGGLLPGYAPTDKGMFYNGNLLPNSLVKDGRDGSLSGLVENKVIYNGVSVRGDNSILRNCTIHEKPYVEKVELNPDDPFDSVIIDMIQMNRKKRNDYAADSDIFSNFRDTAMDLGLEGFGPVESCQVLLLTKVARLKSLRLNGRMANPSNESVLDTYLDLAVYATILLALVKEEGRKSDNDTDSSAAEETSCSRPDDVRPGRIVVTGQIDKEEFLKELYISRAITGEAYDLVMADLRGRTATSAPAEDNDDKDVQTMSSEFLD